MTTGIEIRRNDTGSVAAGTLVLTTNKRNPVLFAKGTQATASSGATYITSTGGGSFLQLQVVCPHDSIPVLISPSHDFCAYNSAWDATLGKWTWQYLTGAPPGTNIDWMVFAEQPLSIIGAGSGIEFYADDGTLLFGSHPNNKPLRIVDVLHGSGDPASVSYPAGPTYGQAIGKHSGKLIWEGDAKPSTISFPDPDYYIKLWWGIFSLMGATDFTSGGGRIDPAPENFVGTNTPDYTEERDWTELDHMVIDVTDY